MKTQPITIGNGRVTIRSNANGVWLTQSQIADLFDVFTSAVHANIRSILKSGILNEDRVFRRTRARNGNLVERYNLEMIVALAFRLKSEKAEVFRKWIIERATTQTVVWKIPAANDGVLNCHSKKIQKTAQQPSFVLHHNPFIAIFLLLYILSSLFGACIIF